MKNKEITNVCSRIEQYVTAYRVDSDALQGILPMEYRSLRPVLRINVELLSGVEWLAGRSYNRVELNTPIEYHGKKGWLNLATWEDDCDSIIHGREVHWIPKAYADMAVEKSEKETKIQVKAKDFMFLEIAFAKVGKIGGCPKEDDNEGTFHSRYFQQIGLGIENMKATGTAFTAVEKIEESKEYCDCSFEWHKPDFQNMPIGHSFLEKICAIENLEILGAYVVNFDRVKDYSDQIVL